MTENTGSRLTKKYVFVLIALGLLAVGNFALLESVILSQETSAAEINIAGRQRMLSQRITLLSNQIHYLKNE